MRPKKKNENAAVKTVARASKKLDDIFKDAIEREIVEKLNHLMKDYGTKSGDYFNLARQLALDYVPGFRPASFHLTHGYYGGVTRGKKKAARPYGRAADSKNSELMWKKRKKSPEFPMNRMRFHILQDMPNGLAQRTGNRIIG
jgi:hypothetical protein